MNIISEIMAGLMNALGEESMVSLTRDDKHIIFEHISLRNVYNVQSLQHRDMNAYIGQN